MAQLLGGAGGETRESGRGRNGDPGPPESAWSPDSPVNRGQSVQGSHSAGFRRFSGRTVTKRLLVSAGDLVWRRGGSGHASGFDQEK